MPLSTTNNDEDNFTLLDFLYDIDEDYVDNLEKKDLYLRINNIINQLDDREKTIIKMYFGFDNNKCHTYKEIAKEYYTCGVYEKGNQFLKAFEKSENKSHSNMKLYNEIVKNKKFYINRSKNKKEMSLILKP